MRPFSHGTWRTRDFAGTPPHETVDVVHRDLVLKSHKSGVVSIRLPEGKVDLAGAHQVRGDDLGANAEGPVTQLR